ncbi:hypothetical protein LK09_14780 [Microbacterium mangrovi]|uniref:Uncharacterized protein n=1 Tax=Microbacterium mangrovi TaxID=1348253 RepID=A0A0B2A4T9_9MICO|nr:hypothetical protein [Microbacterium mangrovi]KHK96593.1 hypothetical protein LK09_14780 [Microbacterium mangrovi]
MAATKETRALLRDALESTTLIELRRRSDSDKPTGFVVGLGKKWVLLARTMDGGFFDGHIAVRLTDIRNVRPDRSFQGQFAKSRPEWPPAPPTRNPDIDLDSTRGLLRTFTSTSTLVGIESDHKYAAMWIGLPNDIVGPRFFLWEVRPDATWHDEPLGYRIRRITTIETESHYLRGLAAITGTPPSAALLARW